MRFWDAIKTRFIDAFHGERRQTKFAVVSVLLVLTVADWYRYGVRIEVWVLWFGLIGYDGHRTLQERKMEIKKVNADEKKDHPVG